MKISIALPAYVLSCIVASLPAKSALADDALENVTLPACVEQHFTPADSTTMTRLSVTILLDAHPDANDIQTSTDKRDAVISDAAKLITRIAEQDCKPQVQAASAVAPPGTVFKTLFQQLCALGARSLQADGQRAGAVFGMDLIKKLDSNVAIDLFGTQRQSTVPASPPAISKAVNIATNSNL